MVQYTLEIGGPWSIMGIMISLISPIIFVFIGIIDMHNIILQLCCMFDDTPLVSSIVICRCHQSY